MTPTQVAYAATVPPHLRSWQLADPARLLRDLAASLALETGQTLLCQVSRPATSQLLVAHTPVWSHRRPADDQCAQDEVEEAMRRLGHRDFDWDDDVRLTSAVVTVVIREGRAVERASDYDVASAIRYANNPLQALISDLVIVTPHGWLALPDRLAGRIPVAVSEAPPPIREHAQPPAQNLRAGVGPRSPR